ncbi:YidH family protein [Alkanindiges sp. WGS2144]|uniref:YidH family protein n=1 Tax=Alkanindiges sp. WGS2144 TaxID=3366808 RepID=UPI0037505E2B
MSNLQDPRVLLALERTLLAWNRSSIALIAFGFLIEKSNFLVRLIEPDKYANKLAFNFGLGLVVVSFGLIISLWSIYQYNIALRSLTAAEFIEGYSVNQPIVLSLFTVFTGLLLMISFVI